MNKRLKLRHTVFFIFSFLFPVIGYCSVNATDSLLAELDRAISKRDIYRENKTSKIRELKWRKSSMKSKEDRYLINREIIDQYNSFICDSAEFYILENYEIAKEMNNEDFLQESKLRLSYIYSLSGLFLQANEILNSIDYENLPTAYKIWFCWNCIRYYENLIIYTDDTKFSEEYKEIKERYRDQAMSLLDTQTDEYRKEYAFKLQQVGLFREAIQILIPIFEKQKPGTHSYAMAAMSLAKVYKLGNKNKEQKYYLVLAAVTDLQLAVKENEALLSLAVYLHENNETDRAYSYIRVALDDALFYNARFKNSVIARVQPIIEDTYLKKIERQRQNIQLYAILVSLFVVILAIMLYINYRHLNAVSKARMELHDINDKLFDLNKKLEEANIVKEKYIAYFMNQCAVYINKLYEYRKEVNRKVKAGQIASLYSSSTGALEKEVEKMYANFDSAFLKLFPNFIDDFNSLLKPGEFYTLEEGKLNTELRIFALIRLGIVDVNQIAVFLRYSPQTVYNYKSKIRRKSAVNSEQFEEEVKKIGFFQ